MFALLLIIAPLDLPADGWIAFEAPAVAGTTRMGCRDDENTMSLDERDDHWNIGHDEDNSGTFERFTVYIEMTNGEPDEVRAVTPDCTVTNAGRAMRMEIDAAAAVDLFAKFLGESRTQRVESQLIGALAHVAHESADRVLTDLAEDVIDEERSDDAIFWLAQRRGDYGREVVSAHLDSRWPLDHREHAVMSLALSEHPEAFVIVRNVAREAEPADLRAQAVIALGITDAPGALADLHSIFLVDESREVRENAIFAMSQLDNPAVAQTLADIIREPRNGELRRSALFWLAQLAGKNSDEVVDDLMRDVL
ncbi:MAG TPA: HEAT repeat domain-containing protein [Gammaproteobacteria bacterium]